MTLSYYSNAFFMKMKHCVSGAGAKNQALNWKGTYVLCAIAAFPKSIYPGVSQFITASRWTDVNLIKKMPYIVFLQIHLF